MGSESVLSQWWQGGNLEVSHRWSSFALVPFPPRQHAYASPPDTKRSHIQNKGFFHLVTSFKKNECTVCRVVLWSPFEILWLLLRFPAHTPPPNTLLLRLFRLEVVTVHNSFCLCMLTPDLILWYFSLRVRPPYPKIEETTSFKRLERYFVLLQEKKQFVLRCKSKHVCFRILLFNF